MVRVTYVEPPNPSPNYVWNNKVYFKLHNRNKVESSEMAKKNNQ